MICKYSHLATNLKVSIVNKVPLIELPSDIREAEAFALQEILYQLSKNKPLQIVLDFSKTNLVDIRCSEVLLNSIQSIKKQEIEVVCWSINKSVMNTLVKIKFTEIVSVDLDTNINFYLIHNSKAIKSMVSYKKLKLFLATQVQSLFSKAYKT
jgi:anti-anti-sigma regulatory factor